MKFIVGIIAIIAVVLVFFVLPNCTGYLVPDSKAVTHLEKEGYSDVQVVSKDVWFVSIRGGATGDVVRFTCEATNPIGQSVTVYVFAGWPWKKCTTRT
jgi:hypothetical protein